MYTLKTGSRARQKNIRVHSATLDSTGISAKKCRLPTVTRSFCRDFVQKTKLDESRLYFLPNLSLNTVDAEVSKNITGISAQILLVAVFRQYSCHSHERVAAIFLSENSCVLRVSKQESDTSLAEICANYKCLQSSSRKKCSTVWGEVAGTQKV